MQRHQLALVGVAALLGLAVACSRHSTSPTAPSRSAAVSTTDAASTTDAISTTAEDSVTLKATAPVPQSPINDAKIPESPPTLSASTSTGKFAQGAFQYRFQVFNDAGTQVQDSGLRPSPSFPVTATLDFEKRYTWRVRAELPGTFGPWSSSASFVTPAGAYIRGNEIRDPLTNGTTVGQIHGPVKFIPGVGVQLLGWDSYISYELPQTLFEGEFSLIVTNMPANTEGEKQKVMAMSQGYDDLITNDRRMTVEKRGDPPGIIAWRFITHDDQIDTVGDERVGYNFLASQTYFYQTSWRNNFFNVLIKEGGVNGRTVYDFGKRWKGRQYDPNPHVIFVGAPIGRSGSAAASIENTIYRNIWVSSGPRPQFSGE